MKEIITERKKNRTRSQRRADDNYENHHLKIFKIKEQKIFDKRMPIRKYFEVSITF